MTPADIKTLAAQAACFTCLPVNTQQAIKTYLLAVIAGGSRDPKILLAQSRAFIGIPSGMQPAVQTYSTAVLAGGITDASAFLKNQACAFECTPGGLTLPIAIYQLAVKANLSPIPKTLAALASCFVCFPDSYLIALQSYLMAVIAGLTTVPKDLLKAATGFINTIPPGTDPGNTGIVVWLGGFAAPTGLTAVQQADASILITWNAGPASATSTEIWTSSDNITFTLTDSVAAPGTTAAIPPTFKPLYVKARFCTGARTVVFPLSDAWMTQVVANGGATPSNLTRASLHAFESDIATLVSKIYHLNVIAPDSLTAALTPFIRTNGAAFWNKVSVGIAPAESLTINGLKSATDGTDGWVYDLGFKAAAVANFTTANGGCFAYCSSMANEGNVPIGFDDGVSAIGVNPFSGGNSSCSVWNGAAPATVAHTAIPGLYLASRTATNLLTLYFGGSAAIYAALTTNAGVNAVVPGNVTNFGGLGALAAGPPTVRPNEGRYSCIGVCDGLTLAQGLILYQAIQALRVRLGGGYA